MAVTLTPEMWLYLTLAIDNAVAAILNRVSKMTAEEITAETVVEEAKKAALMVEINAH